MHPLSLTHITLTMTINSKLKHLILCILILCISCSQEHKDDYSELNKFIELNPYAGLDSVNTLIKDYKGNDVYTKMKLSLLRYKCEDKCYVLHSSDSTIKELHEFFEDNGTISDKMETNYYMGSTYRDMHNYPLAITYYNEAVKIGENNHINYADSMLLANVYSQLSWINETVCNRTISVEQAKHALHIRQKLKIDEISSYQDVANSFYKNNEIDSAKTYYIQCAMKIAYENSVKKNIEYVSAHLQFFSMTSEHRLAKISLEQLQTISTDSLPPSVFANTALYYANIDINLDSCIYYCELALKKEKDYKNKYEITRGLSIYYAHKGDYKKSKEYAFQHFLYEDSANAQDLAEETVAAQNQFKTQELDNMKNALQTEIAKRNEYIVYAMTTMMTILAIICIILYLLNKKKNLYLTEVKKIEEEKTKIAEAHNTLTEIVNADKKLRAESAKDIASVMANINAIANDTKATLTEDQWEDIFIAVDRLYPNFRKHILTYYPAIDNKELIIIYLVMLGQKQADVARLFNNARSVVHRRFHRIDEKLGATIGEVIETYTTQQNAIKAQRNEDMAVNNIE